MSLMITIDEVTVSLMALTLVLGVALGLSSSTPDTPYSRINNQSDVTKIRNKHESAVYRSRLAYGGVKTNHEGAKTFHEIFLRGVEVSPTSPCLGTKTPAGGFGWQTYKEVAERVSHFGSGLISLGLASGQETRVGLLLKNQAEWIIADLACSAFSMVSVGISEQLGRAELEKVLKEANLAAIVCLPDRVSELEAIAATCSVPFKVISTEKPSSPKPEKKLHHFQEVEALGKASPSAMVPPSPTSVATISYVHSMADGSPKGVVLTHMNLLTNLWSTLSSLSNQLAIKKSDVYLSQLSLVNSFERIYVFACFAVGGSIAFSTDPTKFFDDIKLVKPTFTTSPARTLDLLVLKIKRVVNQAGFFKKILFNTVFESKKKTLRTGVLPKSSFWDRLFFVYVREIFGGNLKFLVTVANTAHQDTTDFLRISLGCNIFEAYELTEASGFISMTLSGDYNTGHVGAPIICTDIKLLEVPDLLLFPTDKPGPRGEICIRGPSVFKEYHNDPDSTKSCKIDTEWIRTGELGLFLPNRALKVIGGKASAVKVGDEDVIFLEQLEAIYSRSPYVSEIALRMNQANEALRAFVIPNAEVLLDWAKRNGISGDLPALCDTEQVWAEVLASMYDLAEEQGLRKVERISGLKLDPVPFAQRGVLTSGLRLNRSQAEVLFH